MATPRTPFGYTDNSLLTSIRDRNRKVRQVIDGMLKNKSDLTRDEIMALVSRISHELGMQSDDIGEMEQLRLENPRRNNSYRHRAEMPAAFTD